MATTYGITSAGFTPEPLAQVQADLQAALRAAFGADIDLSANGPFGQLVGILAEREANLWQLAQAIYSATYPDTATGAQLDDLCSLTGVVRLPASKSTVSTVLVGSNGTAVPSGTLFATSPGGTQFATQAAATIATLAAWTASTLQAVGDLRTNGGNIYSCTAPGTTASSGGPTGTGTAITDGGATWRYCGSGTAAVAAACAATATGTLAAPSGTLTVISTAVAGLTSVVNPLDAVIGAAVETDAALRLRRTGLLRAQGNAALAAVQAKVFAVTGVTAALAYQNAGDVTDGAGRPPHSVEVVVQGGTDAAVASALFGALAGGIASYGTYTPQTVTDSAGTVQTVKFTRPTSVLVYAAVTVTRGSAYPSDGDARVKQAIVDYANGLIPEPTNGVGTAFQIGQTVYARPLVAAILDAVPGVLDIPTLNIGTSASPTTSTPLTMTYNQLAAFDTSRVTVS